jgi:hypothetical protein
MLLVTTVTFVLILLVSLAAYSASGFAVRLPLFLATQIVVVAAPVGFGLIQLARGLDAVTRPALSRWLAFVAGLILLAVWEYGGRFPVVVVALMAALVVHLAIRPRTIVSVALAMVALIAWLTSVQFANYIALKHVVGRLRDSLLWDLDAAVYAATLGIETTKGLFPIVRAPLINQILENAYLTLAVQPMAVILFHARNHRRLCAFLISGITCHATALLMFLVFPAVGPTLDQPSSFDPAFAESLTGRAISSMLVDLEAVRQGSQPITGFGYFVALPSLHAAIATLCQLAVRGHTLFWLLLPMNLIMFVSTFLLGQHYIVDPFAGVLLGYLSWRAITRVGASPLWSDEDQPVVVAK